MIAGEHRLALPAGYQLGKYRFKEILGAGGFGITYLAEDSSLGRRVAIKELLPNDIATRLDGSTVVAKTKSEEENLAWARDRFLKEGRALAACEHPNVVHVYEMVEANGTAYMVTKFEEGRSFAEWLKEIEGAPKEKELRALLLPLLSGLEKVHQAGFLHRDLKPENIYITDDGRPILLDFGSARQAVTDRTTSLTSIVTSGYAPFEQYHEDGKQGAWTDLYAMAAVMYRAIHGKKPPEATRRLQNDPCLKLSREYSGKYGAPFLSAIDKALVVEPTKRPQNVGEWRHLLGDAPPEKKIVADPEWMRWGAAAQAWRRTNPMLAAGAAAGVLIVLFGAWKVLQPKSAPMQKTITQTEPAPPVAVTPVPQPPIAVNPPATPAPLPPTPVVEPPVKPPPAAEIVKKEEPPRTEEPKPRRGPRAGERWTNSLGQIYAALPGVPGAPIHMATWETRVGDFEAFVRATGYDATDGMLSWSSKGWKATGASWVKPGFPQTAMHPVVGVNAYDALAFCQWLTEKDRAAGLIDDRLAYRLPTDAEWRKASQDWRFPWGESWPPNVGAGNYAGEESKSALGTSRVIQGYRDNYAGTSPVGTFQGNAAGFFDLGGNACEMCGSWSRQGANSVGSPGNDSEGAGQTIVLRGGSWQTFNPQVLQLEAREFMLPQDRYATVGFRCVLAPVSDKDTFTLPPLRTGPQDLPPGIVSANGEPVERRLVGTWESKSTTPVGQVTLRWVLEADGVYSLTGPFSDAGHLTANAGRIQQVSDTTGLRVMATYRFKTTTQMTTSGPLGEATWRKISSATKPGNVAAVTTEETGNNGSDDSPGASKPAPKPQTQTHPKPIDRNIESRARDSINSMRRRFGF